MIDLTKNYVTRLSYNEGDHDNHVRNLKTRMALLPNSEGSLVIKTVVCGEFLNRSTGPVIHSGEWLLSGKDNLRPGGEFDLVEASSPYEWAPILDAASHSPEPHCKMCNNVIYPDVAAWRRHQRVKEQTNE